MEELNTGKDQDSRSESISNSFFGNSFPVRESTILIVLTIFAYIFGYRFQGAYLAHFGVPQTLILVDLELLIRSGVITLSAAVTAFYLLNSISAKFLGNLLGLFFLLFPALLACGISFVVFRAFGFAWGAILLYLFALFICYLALASLVDARKKQASLAEAAIETAITDRRIIGRTTIDLIEEKIGFPVYLIFVGIFVLPWAAGAALGVSYASNQTKYVSVESESHTRVLVGSYKDTFVLAGVSGAKDGKYFANGSVSILKAEEFSKIELRSFYGKVEPYGWSNHPKSIGPRNSASSRVSFEDFLKRIGTE